MLVLLMITVLKSFFPSNAKQDDRSRRYINLFLLHLMQKSERSTNLYHYNMEISKGCTAFVSFLNVLAYRCLQRICFVFNHLFATFQKFFCKQEVLLKQESWAEWWQECSLHYLRPEALGTILFSECFYSQTMPKHSCDWQYCFACLQIKIIENNNSSVGLG